MHQASGVSRRATLVAAACTALLAAGCVTRPRSDVATAVVPRGTLAMDDRTMAMQAAGAGLYEVEAGRLAAMRASLPAVRDHGHRLAQHHAAANAELASLLAARGLAMPARLPPQFDARLARLAAEPAGSFDAVFVQVAGLQDHRAQVAFFQHASRVAQDADLRDWFARNLPILRQHLQSAQALLAAPAA